MSAPPMPWSVCLMICSRIPRCEVVRAEEERIRTGEPDEGVVHRLRTSLGGIGSVGDVAEDGFRFCSRCDAVCHNDIDEGVLGTRRT